MTPSSPLTFTTDILAACCASPPRGTREDAVGNGLWSVTIPGARSIVPHVIDYAKEGTFRLYDGAGGEFVSARLQGQPAVENDGLRVGYEFTLLGHRHLHGLHVPYPSPEAKSLCRGDWTTFGSGQVQLDAKALLPEFKAGGTGCVVRWSTPPQIRHRGVGRFSLFRRVSTIRIREVVILPDGGQVFADGPLKWAMPRLVWGE